VALGLLGDLGHPATALFGPHPQLESQTSLRRNPNFPIFQTASKVSPRLMMISLGLNSRSFCEIALAPKAAPARSPPCSRGLETGRSSRNGSSLDVIQPLWNFNFTIIRPGSGDVASRILHDDALLANDGSSYPQIW
ncbi:hypothetical protein, partial [Mesorhizobium waimense]|uniref:hypothetical protein n=1 Tax=Mesorhizobium waimense TaxID=1300307 RepID=UPI001ABF5C1D